MGTPSNNSPTTPHKHGKHGKHSSTSSGSSGSPAAAMDKKTQKPTANAEQSSLPQESQLLQQLKDDLDGLYLQWNQSNQQQLESFLALKERARQLTSIPEQQELDRYKLAMIEKIVQRSWSKTGEEQLNERLERWLQIVEQDSEESSSASKRRRRYIW